MKGNIPQANKQTETNVNLSRSTTNLVERIFLFCLLRMITGAETFDQ
jgi:hypothetical protein